MDKSVGLPSDAASLVITSGIRFCFARAPRCQRIPDECRDRSTETHVIKMAELVNVQISAPVD
jgi:hypothetical protein